MKTQELQNIALRFNALYMKDALTKKNSKALSTETMNLLNSAIQLGYSFEPATLYAVNEASASEKAQILSLLRKAAGVDKNWVPMKKNWNTEDRTSQVEYFVRYLIHLARTSKEFIAEQWGAFIFGESFFYDKYNGCPFTGTAMHTEELTGLEVHNIKELSLFGDADMQNVLYNILQSPVALDATQVDNAQVLLSHFDIEQNIKIEMKETLILVLDSLIEKGKGEQAQYLLRGPVDILRYIWYKKTGFLQIIKPKVILKKWSKNRSKKTQRDLNLKFSRTQARVYAQWMNTLPIAVTAICEQMHRHKGMWTKLIRALRLSEFANKKGFEQLARVMACFHNKEYRAWEGEVNQYKIGFNAEQTFALLKQRPGYFARQLFSYMLYFGKDETLKHFREVMHKIPKRLLFTLGMYAESYFDQMNYERYVKPLGGAAKAVPINVLIYNYSDKELEAMKNAVSWLVLDSIADHFEQIPTTSETIYIDEELYKMPLPIGDRSEQVQEGVAVTSGTRFALKSDNIRLFMQWGKGLRAQHLDMDLSALVVYPTGTEYCSYSSLNINGLKHSGDIIHIPHMVGTAEYIEIDVAALKKRGALYVSFTCNAYSAGALSANMQVGWMNSAHEMKVRNTGVAYNPTAVEQQVKITQGLSKGLLFGLLDVQNKEVIWLEMPFDGQVVQNMNIHTINALLKKSKCKLSIGDALEMKAMAQELEIVPQANQADEIYDKDWATDIAKVAKFLLSA